MEQMLVLFSMFIRPRLKSIFKGACHHFLVSPTEVPAIVQNLFFTSHQTFKMMSFLQGHDFMYQYMANENIKIIIKINIKLITLEKKYIYIL